MNEVTVHDDVSASDRGSAAFDRLHALVRKGYEASLGTESGDGSIVLKHLGRAPDLVLRPDGTIMEHEGRIPRHKRRVPNPGIIPAERDADHLKFMKFLETVPKATLRDRTRPWRRKFIYVPALLIIFWGLSLLFTVMIVEAGGGG